MSAHTHLLFAHIYLSFRNWGHWFQVLKWNSWPFLLEDFSFSTVTGVWIYSSWSTIHFQWRQTWTAGLVWMAQSKTYSSWTEHALTREIRSRELSGKLMDGCRLHFSMLWQRFSKVLLCPCDYPHGSRRVSDAMLHEGSKVTHIQQCFCPWLGSTHRNFTEVHESFHNITECTVQWQKKVTRGRATTYFCFVL